MKRILPSISNKHLVLQEWWFCNLSKKSNDNSIWAAALRLNCGAPESSMVYIINLLEIYSFILFFSASIQKFAFIMILMFFLFKVKPIELHGLILKDRSAIFLAPVSIASSFAIQGSLSNCSVISHHPLWRGCWVNPIDPNSIRIIKFKRPCFFFPTDLHH